MTKKTTARRKPKFSLLNLIFSIVGLVGAALTYIALAFNFINTQTTYKVGSSSSTTNSTATLSEWFETIDKAQEYNDKLKGTILGDLHINIEGWATARVFLIITLVLVAIVAIALVVKLFVNHKILNWATLAVAVLTIISALMFIIMVYAGGSAFVGDSESTKALADVGAWFVTLGAVIAGAMGIAVARK